MNLSCLGNSFTKLPWKRVFQYLTTKEIYRLKVVNSFMSTLIIKESRRSLIHPIYEVGLVCRDSEQLLNTLSQYFNIHKFHEEFHLLNVTYQFSSLARIYTGYEVEFIGRETEFFNQDFLPNLHSRKGRNKLSSSSHHSRRKPKVGNIFTRMTVRFYPILLLSSDPSHKILLTREKNVFLSEAMSFLDGYLILYPNEKSSHQSNNYNHLFQRNTVYTRCMNSIGEEEEDDVEIVRKKSSKSSSLSPTPKSHSLSNMKKSSPSELSMAVLNNPFLPSSFGSSSSFNILQNSEEMIRSSLPSYIHLADSVLVPYITISSKSSCNMNASMKKALGQILSNSDSCKKLFKTHQRSLYHSNLLEHIESIIQTMDIQEKVKKLTSLFNNKHTFYELLTDRIDYFVKRIGLRYFTIRDQILIIKNLYSALFTGYGSNIITKKDFSSSHFKLIYQSNFSNLVIQKIVRHATKQQKQEIRMMPTIEINSKTCLILFDDFTSNSIRHVEVRIGMRGCLSQTFTVFKPFILYSEQKDQ
ncbi:hypothetical protein FDP41_001130 [Naegleria fowleri]|uniref:Uncharacterized protein n=1 Tax=Naegleria fowleri TaxID=5763 RepID=A0A6A5BS15_NAEFO|nr:uncharacterized protein FDP41_001130 [Naegleria fowleri]KAF0979977.1 hypothetical protein FDP41_001130 [Naegleria fowleri]CAG4713384.1 unnamed protein product [Naegleria fowleri]